MATMSNIDHSAPTKVEVESVSEKGLDSKLFEHCCLRLTDISDSLEQLADTAGHLGRIDDLVNALTLHEMPDLDGLCREVEGLNTTMIKSSEAIVKAISQLKLTLQLPSTDTKIEVASQPITFEVPRLIYLMASLPFFYLVIYHLAMHYIH